MSKSYFEEFKTAQIRADTLADRLKGMERAYINLTIRLDSLVIKWGKYCDYDEAIEDLEETYK